MKRTILGGLIFGLACSHAFAADLSSGIDAAGIDQQVRAQDDFFRYSQGKWLSGVEIPADRSSWGAFNVAQENVEGQVKSIIESADATSRARQVPMRRRSAITTPASWMKRAATRWA